MEVMVEGTLRGKFVRVYFKDGRPDMHPLVRAAADREIATGLSAPTYPGGRQVSEGFYQSPENFVALMRGTLDEVSKVTGLPDRQPLPEGVIE